MQLNVYPGLKGLKELLGTVPSWIHYEERERVDVRVPDPHCSLNEPDYVPEFVSHLYASTKLMRLRAPSFVPLP